MGLMHRVKNILSESKILIMSAFIHVGLMWVSLALSYNSYKEYVRGPDNINIFPTELRVAIKSTFLFAILIFVALYILYGIGRDKKGDYPTVRQYGVIIALYTAIVNLIFFSKGTGVLIVENLAVLYLVLILLAWGMLRRFIVIDTTVWAEEILPPVVYMSLQMAMLKVRGYLEKKPLSHKFIIGFMALLIICALLLIFKQEKVAEQVANVAYFLLVIGVGIEVCQLVKYGERNEKE